MKKSNMSFGEMIRAANFDFVEPWLLKLDFITVNDEEVMMPELYQFPLRYPDVSYLNHLNFCEVSMRRPKHLRNATIKELLLFAARYPKAQKEGHITALGCGNPCFEIKDFHITWGDIFLSYDQTRGRCLSTTGNVDGWGGKTKFAMVRQFSPHP